jgi:hypothetical protein
MAPPRLVKDQVTLAPKAGGDGPAPIRAVTPLGRYDLPTALANAGIAPDFDVICISGDAMLGNLPQGLDRLPGQKILLVGDTHHGIRPLANLIGYALDQGFDAAVFTYNRQHAHWFLEAGISRSIWLPGLAARALIPAPSGHRLPGLAFLGQIGDLHPRRHRLYQAMMQAGIPLAFKQGSLSQAGALYGGHVLSWNASLNGDLNLRIFEILAAGGCLLTDRLSAQSGLGLLLEEGRHYLAYDSAAELISLTHTLLADAPRAQAIGHAGADAYRAQYRPDHWRKLFADFIDGQAVPDTYALDNDLRLSLSPAPGQDFIARLSIYETVQELQRCQERVSIALCGQKRGSLLFDLSDLQRVDLMVIDPAPDMQDDISLINGSLGARIEILSAQQAMGRRFDVVIDPSGRSDFAAGRILSFEG